LDSTLTGNSEARIVKDKRGRLFELRESAMEVDMAYLVMVILDDLDYLSPLLDAWRELGVPGATIMKSAGAHRVHTWLSKVGLSAIDHLFDSEDVERRTLITAIDDEEMLDRAIAEAERVVGGFHRPNTGVLLVLPIVRASGIYKKRDEEEEEITEPVDIKASWVARRDMPVEEVPNLFDLKPTIIRDSSSMDQAACAMMGNPLVHVACVVAEDERLIGLLDLDAVSDYLFMYIMPEEFLANISDLEDVQKYAERSRVRTVIDAMRNPVWVKRGETVKQAFERMHTNRLTGVPVVDDTYRVVGFINMMELLSICSDQVCLTGHLDDQQEP
jgi:CBS domain-containing protein